VNAKARRDGLASDKVAADPSAAATGSAPPTKPVRHHDLDHLAGVWSQEEYDEFMQALREQRAIDPEMWK
jgi:hypothetical protein